jgi:hypothetical protein
MLDGVVSEARKREIEANSNTVTTITLDKSLLTCPNQIAPMLEAREFVLGVLFFHRFESEARVPERESEKSHRTGVFSCVGTM